MLTEFVAENCKLREQNVAVGDDPIRLEIAAADAAVLAIGGGKAEFQSAGAITAEFRTSARMST